MHLSAQPGTATKGRAPAQATVQQPYLAHGMKASVLAVLRAYLCSSGGRATAVRPEPGPRECPCSISPGPCSAEQACLPHCYGGR